jgi:hypothetical protein
VTTGVAGEHSSEAVVRLSVPKGGSDGHGRKRNR